MGKPFVKWFPTKNQMYSINKITSNSTVDFAAEELKKYLRMMMPECGEVFII